MPVRAAAWSWVLPLARSCTMRRTSASVFMAPSLGAMLGSSRGGLVNRHVWSSLPAILIVVQHSAVDEHKAATVRHVVGGVGTMRAVRVIRRQYVNAQAKSIHDQGDELVCRAGEEP